MNFNASTKINDKWRTVISLKDGEKGKQLSFSPEAKTLFVNWLKDPNPTWLNLPVFENEDKPKSKPLPNVEDEDFVPF